MDLTNFLFIKKGDNHRGTSLPSESVLLIIRHQFIRIENWWRFVEKNKDLKLIICVMMILCLQNQDVFFETQMLILIRSIPKMAKVTRTKYLETNNRKILSQEMLMCNMKTLISIIQKLWPMSFFCKRSKCRSQKV